MSSVNSGKYLVINYNEFSKIVQLCPMTNGITAVNEDPYFSYLLLYAYIISFAKTTSSAKNLLSILKMISGFLLSCVRLFNALHEIYGYFFLSISDNNFVTT